MIVRCSALRRSSRADCSGPIELKHRGASHTEFKRNAADVFVVRS